MTQRILKNKAIDLRQEGYSYSFISKKLNIAKSTLSYWLSEIEYKPNIYTLNKIGKARTSAMVSKSKKKLDSILNAKKEAKNEIGQLTNRDIFMLGLGVYVGEGNKTHDIIRVANSEPKIIRFTIKWFQVVCGLQISNFAIRIHMYPDNNENRSLHFWSKSTGIPISNFKKSSIDRRQDKKKLKNGKLPFGTAHLLIKSNGNKDFGVLLARKINAWMNEVLK